MNTYKKPVAEKISFTYENQVVAASSPDGGCYTVSAYIHQVPETGRGDFRIQVNAQHSASHSCSQQTLYISFNQPVTYKWCNGSGAYCISGDGTTTLAVGLSYWNNPTDSIGIGDLVVESEAGLAITGCSMTDNGQD